MPQCPPRLKSYITRMLFLKTKKLTLYVTINQTPDFSFNFTRFSLDISFWVPGSSLSSPSALSCHVVSSGL